MTQRTAESIRLIKDSLKDAGSHMKARDIKSSSLHYLTMQHCVGQQELNSICLFGALRKWPAYLLALLQTHLIENHVINMLLIKSSSTNHRMRREVREGSGRGLHCSVGVMNRLRTLCCMQGVHCFYPVAMAHTSGFMVLHADYSPQEALQLANVHNGHHTPETH